MAGLGGCPGGRSLGGPGWPRPPLAVIPPPFSLVWSCLGSRPPPPPFILASRPSGLSAHLLAIFGRAGLDAATVVAVGALFGPAQVFARICELMFARDIHPLMVARFAVAMLLAALVLIAFAGLSAPTAAAFAVM